MKNLKEKLLQRLPKKYHSMVADIKAQEGLIDDCKYMLYFNEGVAFAGYEETYCYPVRSINEAVKIIKEDCEYVRKEPIEIDDDFLRQVEKEITEILKSYNID